MHYDIAIIGYGPVGAAAASMFGKKGFNIVVVEPKKDIWDIPRAVHFDGQVQRVFQTMGISSQVEEIVDTMTGITFLNHKGNKIVSLDMTNAPRKNSYHEDVMFDQPKFERILRNEAEKNENIDFKMGSYVSNLIPNKSNNILEIIDINTNQKTEISSSYVIGSDGADSFVRKSTNIESKDFKEDEDWIVVDYLVDDKFEINRQRYQVCDYRRPTTLLPITGNHVRWEFKVKPDDIIEDLEKEENIRNFMEPHLWRLHPDIDKNSGKLLRASKYTFHAVLAENFKFNNCFLIGDAAHQTPPFLGQGLCQGIKDAYNLCWKLSGVIEKKYDKKILESFSTERKEINNFMIKASVEQAKIVGSLDKFKAFRRDVFLTLARIFPKLQGVLTFQYKWQFKNGILDKDLYPNDSNGMIIPHPDLSIKKDNKQFDEYMDDKFSLILFNLKKEEIDNVNKLDSVKSFDGCVHHFDENHIFMSDGKLLKWSKKNNISAVVLRPDKHVYGCCDIKDIESKVDKLINKLHNDLI